MAFKPPYKHSNNEKEKIIKQTNKQKKRKKQFTKKK